MSFRAYRGAAFAALLFLLVQLGALALVPTFYEQGYQTVQNPSDPTNSLLYLAGILVVTGLMLAAFRFDLDRVVRGVIVFTSGLLSWYVFGALLPSTPTLALALAAGVAIALLVYPEWYVIDAAGVVMGAGAAGLFGISFGLLPALVLLVALAVYDAISVYGTEHMLSLAEGVMELRIPVVVVIPLTLSYSLLDANPSVTDDENADSGPDTGLDADIAGEDGARDAFFIGLGDAVMPTVLVASAAFFSPARGLGVGWLPALNWPALGAMAGTLLGLGVLLWAVAKGRAHAGLPLLNGGAIGGYLVGSAIAGVSLVRALGLGPYL